MSCRVATGFLYHDLNFSVDAPGGYAPCRRCGALLDRDLFLSEHCPGSPEGIPFDPTIDLVCALCGDPIIVDPMHRAIVEAFGSTCERCFETHDPPGADPAAEEPAIR
ncbi:MAG: hypothetical protein PHS14_16935 [Elusimicrobia bacterium]|nr:hypothetical protein [Elusimicrobiota bacterium]